MTQKPVSKQKGHVVVQIAKKSTACTLRTGIVCSVFQIYLSISQKQENKCSIFSANDSL